MQADTATSDAEVCIYTINLFLLIFWAGDLKSSQFLQNDASVCLLELLSDEILLKIIGDFMSCKDIFNLARVHGLLFLCLVERVTILTPNHAVQFQMV